MARMEVVRRNLELVRERIAKAAARAARRPEEITLVGVSKVQPVEKIQAAVDAGLSHVGENRVQEAASKIPQVHGKVCWHLVGHLQRNKAKKAVEIFDVIESIDTERIAEEVSKRCRAAGKVMDVLLEVNLEREPSKTGVEPGGLLALAEFCAQLDSIKVSGIMVIPPYEPDPEKSRPYFQKARRLFDELRAAGIPGVEARELSMGMSNDFEVAIEEGATIVRVGTAIFGPRQY